MTQPQFLRTRFSEVMEYDTFLKLDKVIQKRQTFPEYAKIKTVDFFGNKKTNLLTAVCVWWIKAMGGFASRQSSTGIPIKRKDGTTFFKPAPGMVGAGDIYAMFGGRTIWIEIKFGRDVQSDKQKKFEKLVTEQGAEYWIVRSFDGLLVKLDELHQSSKTVKNFVI